MATGFSLIVVTRNRPQELTRLLTSLDGQTYREFEVIIIDQSDPEELALNGDAVNGYAGRMGILHLPMDGTGLSRGRNLGLGHVTGGYVAFPDDDCAYPPGLLQHVHEWMEQNSKYAFLSGQYVDFDGTRAYFPDKPQDITTLNVFGRLSSITVFFRAEALAGLAFDERLGSGTELPASEEIDFVFQLLRSGHRGRYDPSFFLYHKVRRPAMQDPAILALRDKANSYVLLKNAMRGSRLLWPYVLARYVRDLSLCPFSAQARTRFGIRARGYHMAAKAGMT